MRAYLEFEKPIAELENKIQELGELDGEPEEDGNKLDLEEEIKRLEVKAQTLLAETYSKLTPWQKTQVARHPNRPHFGDYASRYLEDYTPLAGDRCFSEDQAIVGGLGRFRNRSVMMIGHEKGTDTQSRVKHNFGMARPEGYRKAIRLMRMADRFGLPVITIVDTPGAYPGIGAEERGQAEAIARSTEACLELGVPIISCITGEGGSGGAVALATGNKVIMLEHSIYAVISPEGCASILWRSADKAQDAAEAMKLTAKDLLELKVIDKIVPEPVGGAHRAPDDVMDALGDILDEALREFDGQTPGQIRTARREKFLAVGRLGLIA